MKLAFTLVDKTKWKIKPYWFDEDDESYDEDDIYNE